MLYFIKGLSEDKPNALFTNTLVRAKMAELIANHTNAADKSSEYYTVGMLSMLDAYLDRPLENIIKELSLTEEVKKAVLNLEGKIGETLEMIILFEQARWSQLKKIELKFNLDSNLLFSIYQQAIENASETIEKMNQ
jgi:EAL and modified HD-GYP domain-containing signal transduction protein